MCIAADSSWAKPKQISWGAVIESPETLFGKTEFQLYDLDLNWALEYKIQEVARFGKFGVKINA